LRGADDVARMPWPRSHTGRQIPAVREARGAAPRQLAAEVAEAPALALVEIFRQPPEKVMAFDGL